MSSKSEKTSIILSACKYAAACAVLPAVLLAAGTAGAADAYQTGNNGGGTMADPSAQDSTYVPTPIGQQSEAWGDGPTGPGHLRRMSPTEALPAEPQVEKVIEVPSYGVPGGN